MADWIKGAPGEGMEEVWLRLTLQARVAFDVRDGKWYVFLNGFGAPVELCSPMFDRAEWCIGQAAPGFDD